MTPPYQPSERIYWEKGKPNYDDLVDHWSCLGRDPSSSMIVWAYCNSRVIVNGTISEVAKADDFVEPRQFLAAHKGLMELRAKPTLVETTA